MCGRWSRGGQRNIASYPALTVSATKDFFKLAGQPLAQVLYILLDRTLSGTAAILGPQRKASREKKLP